MNLHSNLIADDRDVALLAAIENGLPLVIRPFGEIGKQLQMAESEVIARFTRMVKVGIIRRFGLVLQHRPLGYRANAMVVWDVPDGKVDHVAGNITSHDFVTLCYSRTRQAPVWPYNLYCMIHGRKRDVVEGQIAALKKSARLEQYASTTLFSTRLFKQKGAHFSCPAPKRQKNPPCAERLPV